MKLSDLGERRIIGKLRQFLDIGDDAAYIKSGDEYLILTTDMIYRDTHILKQMTWKQIGKLVVTVNLSDVAAMGAKPLAFLLSYGSPDMEFRDFKILVKAVKKQCDKFNTIFAGGDTNQMEKLTLAGSLVGTTKKPVLRSGARVGDVIAVTGHLGSASLGTKILLEEDIGRGELNNQVFQKTLQPEPRVDEGMILSEYVTSMTDTSDGLSTSLRDISENSKVGAEIELKKIPIDVEACNLAKERGEEIIEHALHGEGDYELLFTASERNFEKITDMLPLHEIGRVTGGGELIGINFRHKRFKIAEKGYEHFR